jgi:hypothetical protein
MIHMIEQYDAPELAIIMFTSVVILVVMFRSLTED